MKTLIWLWRVYWCDWTKELSDERSLVNRVLTKAISNLLPEVKS